MPKQQNSKKSYNPSEDPDIWQYQEEVKQRWGNTEAYRQSAERVSKMTKAEMEKLKKDSGELTKNLAANMDKGVGSKEVQTLIAQHHKSIQFFYDCPLEMYRNLGKMYTDDSRFTAYYDEYRPDLAVFVRNAIAYFCDKKTEG